jgi:clathrin heavy chain
MMDHVESAWDYPKFLEDIVHVRNPELLYKSITFYLQNAPEMIGALLTALQPKLDHARSVAVLKKSGLMHLAVPYLRSVQSSNVAAVNEALNDVLIEEEDHTGLQASIDEFSNFDHVALAQKLEKHELQQFRRVAASLYAKQKKFTEAVKLLKADKLYKDAMETTAQSKDTGMVMDLLTFFIAEHEKECFAATLFSCYELVSPDIVLELAWRHNLHDVAMPFMIQWTRDTHAKIKELDERTKPKSDANQEATSFMQDGRGNAFMLANTAFNPEPQGYGMQQQQYMQQQYMQQQGFGGYNGGM